MFNGQLPIANLEYPITINRDYKLLIFVPNTDFNNYDFYGTFVFYDTNKTKLNSTITKTLSSYKEYDGVTLEINLTNTQTSVLEDNTKFKAEIMYVKDTTIKKTLVFVNGNVENGIDPLIED